MLVDNKITLYQLQSGDKNTMAYLWLEHPDIELPVIDDLA